MGKLCVHVDVVDECIDVEKEVRKFRSRLYTYLDDTGFGTVVREDADECPCWEKVPGVLFPMTIDGSEEFKQSHDGHVLVSRCDECAFFASDHEAALFLSALTGTRIKRWYDADSEEYWHYCLDMSLDLAERVKVTRVCHAPGCDNANRYDSGYCGIHDIELNGGRGTRRL